MREAAALAALVLAASLAGCASAPPKPDLTTAEAAGNAPTAPAAPLPPVIVPGPSPDTFVGEPVAALEALLGEPALVRGEGLNEFRRYDVTEDCRAYAVVVPAGGTVESLTTGASVAGAPAPRFEDCTAREVTPAVGS
jgi:hypothetical protein